MVSIEKKLNVPIVYKNNFCKDKADYFLKTLWEQLDWVRHDKVPRREYYVNHLAVPYTYGTPPFDRTYAAQPTHEVIETIRSMVEEALLKEFGKEYIMDVCFLNGYEDQSDQLGWHADDSPEMDDERPIVIVSLGVEREIYFREIGNKSNVTGIEKLKLGHGSMCIMLPGMQDTYQHRIPKASFMCGVRISLTFRGYVKPK